MAGDETPLLDLAERRHRFPAHILCIRAPRVERASGRDVQRRRDLAVQLHAFIGSRNLRIRNRHGGHQGFCIRMQRPVIDLARVSQLDHPAQIHDRDAVRDMADHKKIMCDKQVGQVHLGLKLVKHIDDLCLNRHVERGYRLVADHKVRIHGQGSRDADPLALSAGKLVCIARGVLGVEADAVHQLEDAVSSLLL